MPMSRSRDGDKCVSGPRPADFHCVGSLLRGLIFGSRFQRERNAFSEAIDRWKTRGDGRRQVFCRGSVFQTVLLFCGGMCHARNEWPIFRGERSRFYRCEFPAFRSYFCPMCSSLVCWLSCWRCSFAILLCRFLIFYGGAVLVWVTGMQRVLDCRAENPDGRHFMSVASEHK